MQDETPPSRESAQSSFGRFDPLLIHRLGVLSLYGGASVVAIAVIGLPEAQKDLISLLSVGAIFATFGSAISTLGSVWERDLLERIRLNVDILYKDILRQEIPWRRWPFLPRIGKRRLLDDPHDSRRTADSSGRFLRSSIA